MPPLQVVLPVVVAASAAPLATGNTPGMAHLLDPDSMLILGSVVGACFSIGIGKRAPIERRFYLKFAVSLACGVLFTPGVFRYAGWPWAAEIVGPIACLVSALAVGILHRYLPRLEVEAQRRLDKDLPHE